MTDKYSPEMERADVRFLNMLSPAHRERLILLMEECAEVQQVIGKILRHGYESYHPDTPEVTNRMLLERELGDVGCALTMMMSSGDVDAFKITEAATSKTERVKQYLHFQE